MSKLYDLEKDIHYLQLLAHAFPTIAEASTEIINLQTYRKARSISLPTCMASMKLSNMY